MTRVENPVVALSGSAARASLAAGGLLSGAAVTLADAVLRLFAGLADAYEPVPLGDVLTPFGVVLRGLRWLDARLSRGARLLARGARRLRDLAGRADRRIGAAIAGRGVGSV